MNTSNLQKTVVCVCLRTSCFGTTVTDENLTDKVTTETEAARGKLKVQKARLKEAVEPFRKLRTELRKRFNSLTLPGISDDMRLLPSSRLQNLRDIVEEYRSKDETLLSTLIDNYPAEIEKDRLALGAAFDQTLYPPTDRLSSFFRIGLTVTNLPNGDFSQLQNLDAASKAQAKAEHDALLKQIAVQARTEVIGKMTDLISKIAEKLTNPDAKNFHETTFTNLKDYLDLVPSLNVTNDPLIAKLAAEAGEKLNFSMSEVKKNAFLKEQAATAAKDLVAQIHSLSTGRKLVA